MKMSRLDVVEMAVASMQELAGLTAGQVTQVRPIVERLVDALAVPEAAQAPAPDPEAVTVDVVNCPRCTESHRIDVRPLRFPAAMNVRVYGYAEPLPVATWTHWGMCPSFDEPIFHGQQPEYGMDGVVVEQSQLPAPPSTGAATGDPRP